MAQWPPCRTRSGDALDRVQIAVTVAEFRVRVSLAESNVHRVPALGSLTEWGLRPSPTKPRRRKIHGGAARDPRHQRFQVEWPTPMAHSKLTCRRLAQGRLNAAGGRPAEVGVHPSNVAGSWRIHGIFLVFCDFLEVACVHTRTGILRVGYSLRAQHTATGTGLPTASVVAGAGPWPVY
jgi:hypothetical protein